MISLAEQLTYNTVRLEGNTSTGSTVGTGFHFLHQDRLFIVTNKHVVDGVVTGNFICKKAFLDENGQRNPVDGPGVNIPFSGMEFFWHPDPNIDVAIMNVSAKYMQCERDGIPIYSVSVSQDQFLNPDLLEKFIGPIEDVTFVGYPNGLWDHVNLQPIVRKGITATACYKKFKGEEKFLIDASVFPGSSGSPVYIYYAGSYPDKHGKLYIGDRLHFIGIISQVYQRQERGEIKIVDIPTAQRPIAEINQMLDLGVVFNSNTIKECADHFMKMVPVIAQPNDS